jgi:adenosylcobinamide-GDP ribazoletransferase
MSKIRPVNSFSTALKTLTLVSWPGKESEDLSTSLPWFPVVGLAIGMILFAIGHTWTRLLPGQWLAGAALLVVGVEVWLTRGLHMDGLADWADSIGGFQDREKRLAIMKDVSLGAFGVLALILALMAKWVAFERILDTGSTIWLLPILALSRGMMVYLITILPYARAEEGMAKPFVKGASPKHRLASHLICLGICLPFGPLGLAFFVFGGFVTWLFKMRCLKRFGGITGDLLGTANEMVEICLLLICALLGKSILNYTGWVWVLNAYEIRW